MYLTVDAVLMYVLWDFLYESYNVYLIYLKSIVIHNPYEYNLAFHLKEIWFYWRKCIKNLPKWDRWFLVNSSPFEFEDKYKIQNLQVLGSYSGTPS